MNIRTKQEEQAIRMMVVKIKKGEKISMTYKKLLVQTTILISCITLTLHAELPLTHIKGLAVPFRKQQLTNPAASEPATPAPAAAEIVPAQPDRGPATAAAITMVDQQQATQENSIDDNIFSPIYGALAWHSPYLLNLWQLDSESATANLVQQLFNLQFDGVTFDVSGIPANMISHLSCENIGYIIGLLYNYEQAINIYQKQVAENTALLQAEIHRTEKARQKDLSGHEAQQGETSPRAEQQRTPSPDRIEQDASSPRSKAGKKLPRPISPFQEKQREFAKYKNEEPLRIKKELVDKLIAYLDTLNPVLIKKNIVTYYSSQIAHLEADIAREQDAEKVQILQRKKTDLESKLATEQSADTIMLRAYSEGKNAFVKDIVGSMLDTRYLPHNTTLLLLACMWKKANNFEDIMHYMYGVYSALDNKAALFTSRINTTLGMTQVSTATHTFESQPVDIASSISYQTFTSILMPIIDVPPYSAAEYQILMQRNPAELFTNLADYACAFLCFNIFGDANFTLLPPEVSMIMQTQYGETTFPDCGETSLLKFFTAVLYNPVEKNWNHQFLDAINADQKLKKFFIDFSPSSLSTQDAHNAWAQVVSGKADVDYTRANRCEINAGANNMLKVIAALIPGATTFDNLARILTSNGVQINFTSPVAIAWNENMQVDRAYIEKSKSIPIQLIKNEIPLQLNWQFYPGHFHLSFPPKTIFNDPRPRMLSETQFHREHLMTDTVLKSLLSQYKQDPLSGEFSPANYYQLFLYKVQSPQELVKLIDFVAHLPEENVSYKIPLIRSLYNTLSHKQLPDHDQEMYQRMFWDIIQQTKINPENILLEKDIASTKDIQKTCYIQMLLTQPTINIEKIKKYLPEMLNDSNKHLIIKAILEKDPIIPAVGLLYEIIGPILPTIQEEAFKHTILRTILEKDPSIPAVGQLYEIIGPMAPTIKEVWWKDDIIEKMLEKNPTIPAVHKMQKSLHRMLYDAEHFRMGTIM